MHDNKSDVKQYNTSGYNSSRLSFTIVGVNMQMFYFYGKNIAVERYSVII